MITLSNDDGHMDSNLTFTVEPSIELFRVTLIEYC